MRSVLISDVKTVVIIFNSLSRGDDTALENNRKFKESFIGLAHAECEGSFTESSGHIKVLKARRACVGWTPVHDYFS